MHYHYSPCALPHLTLVSRAPMNIRVLQHCKRTSHELVIPYIPYAPYRLEISGVLGIAAARCFKRCTTPTALLVNKIKPLDLGSMALLAAHHLMQCPSPAGVMRLHWRASGIQRQSGQILAYNDGNKYSAAATSQQSYGHDPCCNPDTQHPPTPLKTQTKTVCAILSPRAISSAHYPPHGRMLGSQWVQLLVCTPAENAT